MRFIDASTFLYAFLKPEGLLPPDAVEMKAGAQGILRRVNDGERVITSVIHVSEVANVLETCVRLSECRRIVSDIVAKRSVEVIDVSKNKYISSIHTAGVHDVGVNDALALSIMQERGVDDIYSFDGHFDKMPEIRRLTR